MAYHTQQWATARAINLRQEWESVLRAKERRDTPANCEAEQKAWDALIDHVEESGLNFTEYDPRGKDDD